MTDQHKGGRLFLVSTARRAATTGPRLADRLRWLILHRAIKKAVQSIKRHPPPGACLLRDIGLNPTDAERLASELHVLAADPFHISVKPDENSRGAQ